MRQQAVRQVRRADGSVAAVTIDDVAQSIGEVMRGHDATGTEYQWAYPAACEATGSDGEGEICWGEPVITCDGEVCHEVSDLRLAHGSVANARWYSRHDLMGYVGVEIDDNNVAHVVHYDQSRVSPKYDVVLRLSRSDRNALTSSILLEMINAALTGVR